MTGQEKFRSYLDESANTSNEHYVVGGFVGEADVWMHLEPLWLECLPPGITTFHATDCFSGNNDFEDVSIANRVELLHKITDLIAGHEVRLIGCGLDAKKYRKLAPKRRNNDFGQRICRTVRGGGTAFLRSDGQRPNSGFDLERVGKRRALGKMRVLH